MTNNAQNGPAAWVKQQIGHPPDLYCTKLSANGTEMELMFIRSICEEQTVQQHIIGPFCRGESKEQFLRYLHTLTNCTTISTPQDSLQGLLSGKAVLFLDDDIYLFAASKDKNDNITEATIESTIQGPRNAFSENIQVNVNMLRLRYPQPSLKFEEHKIGKQSKTTVLLAYDERYVETDVLKRIHDSLARVDAEVLQSAAQLHLYMNNKKRALFPTMLTTERPDRVVFNLSEGKVAILVQGTPFALIAPTVLFDFMSSVDDYYTTYWVRRLTLILRYMGLIVCLTLASFYVVLTSYNPEVLRVQLALSIAGSRAPVPYPSYIEVLFMLLMMELLMEASIRLPKAIGSTATTVGGLILGQAATQAGLVSNIMIIIVAAVGISNFMIPVISLNFGIRTIKYLLLVLSSAFGLMGLLLGLVVLIAHLSGMESFGKPYLRLFSSPNRGSSRTNPDNAAG